MTPYYQKGNVTIYNGDCIDVLNGIDYSNSIIVTDPPFNMGYHYKSYKDNLKEEEYYEWLSETLKPSIPFVVIHYPECIYKLAFQVGLFPKKVVSWVYNSNTPRQHRDIAFFGINPDFKKVKQPYKNPSDKRIKARMEKGIGGGRLYDWWNINQVKNVQKKSINHPCVMPLEVMDKIIKLLPEDKTIIDTFNGSGTTALACIDNDRKYIGIEIEKEYCDLTIRRIETHIKQERLEI